MNLQLASSHGLNPKAPFFDAAQNAWILTRYKDVSDALRQPALRQAGSQRAPAHARSDVLEALCQSKMSHWHDGIEPLAGQILRELPQGKPIDLVNQVLRPWSCGLSMVVLGLDAQHCRQLAALQPYLTNSPVRLGSWGPLHALKKATCAVQRHLAQAGLHRILRRVNIHGAQSLLLGVSQTLPDFLACAWLALLENPCQFSRLRAEPHLMPRAIEELLRYCGPVHTLVRQADHAVELSSVTIAGGDRVILKVAQANRDPDHFSEPDSLNVAGQNSGHLALGAGPHSCPGAQLLRMAAGSATRAFAEHFATAKIIEPVIWRRGSVLDSPTCLRVTTRAKQEAK